MYENSRHELDSALYKQTTIIVRYVQTQTIIIMDTIIEKANYIEN